MTYYMANQIVDRHDSMTRGMAESEVMTQCGVKDPKTATTIVNASTLNAFCVWATCRPPWS